jgi:hypothetical protein
VAVVLALFSAQQHKGAVAQISWSTILLIAGVLTFVFVLQEAGTIDYVGEAVTGIGAPLLVALLLCYIGAVVSAFASSVAIIAVAIALAVPFLQAGTSGRGRGGRPVRGLDHRRREPVLDERRAGPGQCAGRGQGPLLQADPGVRRDRRGRRTAAGLAGLRRPRLALEPEGATLVPGPLDGVLVVDLTRALAGPHAGMMLGDLGARVIKVETPGSGDDSRGWGPPFVDTPDGGRESTYFFSANRNKESVTLDLKDDGDKALLTELVRRADVLLENFRPGTLARLGFGTDVLTELNPRLVTLAISGFGHDGPEGGRAGYDQIAQGEAAEVADRRGPETPEVRRPDQRPAGGMTALRGVGRAAGARAHRRGRWCGPRYWPPSSRARLTRGRQHRAGR